MNPNGVITVGVLTPHTAARPEVELPSMAPAHVRVRVARVRDRVSSSDDVADSSTSLTLLADARRRATPEALHDAASALFPGEVDVLAFASTSSGYAIGHHAESALVQRLQQRWRIPVCASSLSAVLALRSHRIERISLVHPPWLGRELSQLGAEYYRSQGFEVVDAHVADLPDDPDQIETTMVVEWVSQHLSDRAEAVVIGGNGFRAAHAIDPLENSIGRLVLEANQVLLWSIFASTGASFAIRGYGTLFEDRGAQPGQTTWTAPPVKNATRLTHTLPTSPASPVSDHVPRPTGSHRPTVRTSRRSQNPVPTASDESAKASRSSLTSQPRWEP